MVEIIWSARSIKDIDEIAEFIAKDSLQYAEEQVNQIFQKTSFLEHHPYAGRIVPELNTSSIRQLLCGHYRIIYEVLSKNKIGIITIHHQARLLKNTPTIKTLRRKR